ncbi:MAG: LemA family protein [Nanoarchaeota archaeon]|nr:LemA family protein [Nanoarchaeota archaeon]
MVQKKSNQDKWLKIGLIAVGVIILISLLISPYNKLVGLDEEVQQSWSDVQVQYQRRADLIPNLVETVKGYASQEQTVLTEVTEARSAWASAQASGDQASQIAAAQSMDGALSRLLVTVEAYPDLKSNQNFIALQDELAGTENRVSVARTRYNEAVATYNKMVRQFPSNIYAGMLGFDRKESFQANSGSQNAPQVEF